MKGSNNTPKTLKNKKAKGEKRTINEKHLNNYVVPPVTAKCLPQKLFLRDLNTHQVVVFNGPAGVGKSYVTMSQCTDWIKKGIFDKMVISRPNIGMGSSLKALPGDVRDKFEPYLLPMVQVIKERYGNGFYESSLSSGVIEFAPLEFIRGRNFNDLVIIDEAQNIKPEEMYTIITRVADGGKLILLGDPTQNDLPTKDGLTWLIEFIKKNPGLKKYISLINATSDDIVRGDLCKLMVKAKEKEVNER